MVKRQQIILVGFLGAQVLDVITTHIGLENGRRELNGVADSLINSHGELMVYALKFTLVALLLGLLLIVGKSKPRIWDAYLVAAWITTAAVLNNVLRIAF